MLKKHLSISMINKFIKEFAISTLLVGLVFILINPTKLWMPQPVHMLLLAGVTVCFMVFAGLIWYEKAKDEREIVLRDKAGRAGYLGGLGILMVGFVVQSFHHQSDPWLTVALLVMILSKVLSQIFTRITN